MMKIQYVILSLVCSGSGFAQTGSVNGTVKTNDGQPASFVNVYLKGTNRGTVTDTEGNLELAKVKAGSYILVASFVGLKAKSEHIKVIDNQTIKILAATAMSDFKNLSQVVLLSFIVAANALLIFTLNSLRREVVPQ